MQLEDYQRVRVDQIVSQRGWVCQQCGSALSSAGLAYEVPDGRVAVELRCTNRGEPHPEGSEVASMALSDDEAGVIGIPVRRENKAFRPKSDQFPHAPD